MNFDNFKHKEENLPSEHDKKEIYFENLRKDFLKEITDSNANKDFFKDYNKVDVDAFKLRYANHKAYLCEHYEYYVERADGDYLSAKTEAEKVFSFIKQKQLFNLQQKWRAEEIELEGVETTFDFQFLHNNINECFFLPPITDYEVQILKEYILDENTKIDDIDDTHSWQYYNLIMPMSPDDDNFRYPKWYKYYDKKMGTGALLSLPDIKGEKEKVYADIAFNKKNGHLKKKKTEELKEEKISLIDLSRDHGVNFDIFAKQFETDEHIIELFRQYKIQYTFDPDEEIEEIIPSNIYNENNVEDDYIDRIIADLCGFEEQIPMQEGLQWREALIHCLQNYTCNRIVNFIDAIYEEYQMFINMGVSASRSKAELLEEMRNDSSVLFHRNKILDGRKELGEPLDFKY
ncbi:MAG: hypothetical protein WCL51_15105 [Bacteroidota bacterium]